MPCPPIAAWEKLAEQARASGARGRRRARRAGPGAFPASVGRGARHRAGNPGRGRRPWPTRPPIRIATPVGWRPSSGPPACLSALAAARAGKRVLLANKEALVAAGSLFMGTVRDHGAELLPIDSEHNAIFQCPPHGERASAPTRPAAGVRRLILTASGRPFRQHDPEQLHGITPAQACKHPNWSMGRKISVDSATMLNKGLEVIEAALAVRHAAR